MPQDLHIIKPPAWITGDLAAIEALTGTGILARTATDTWATRTLTAPAAGFTITNPAGIAGDPTFVLANDLAALEGLSTSGFSARTGSDTWAIRTLTAPAAGLTITNPAGTAGDPTFALANDLAALEGLANTGMARRTGTDTWTTDEWTNISQSNVTTSDATTGTAVQAFTVTSAGVYELRVSGSHTAGATTTGLQFALIRSGGCTLTYEMLEADVFTGGAASELGFTLSTTDGFSTGANSSGATERPFFVRATFVVNNGGTLTLQLRSEVGASAVTLVRAIGYLHRVA